MGTAKAMKDIAAALHALWADPRGRAGFFAFAFVLAWIPVNAVMFSVSGWSALWPTRVWALGGHASLSDSWRVMILALDWIRAHPGEKLYQAIFFEQQTRFQYAPTALLPLVALESLGLKPTPALLDGLNRIFIAAGALAVATLAHRLSARLRLDPPLGWLAATLSGAACLLFYPLMMGFHLGQLQVWINALFAIACLAWLAERRLLAGVLIGLICLLKPQFALFALWAPIRREWRFLAGLIATGAVGGLASLALFGLANHLDYLTVLQFLSRTGESYAANQSVNGLVHRLLGHGIGAWDPNAFPPFDPLVYGATLLSSLTLLAGALYLKRGEGPLTALFDFQLAALAFTIASPIAWEHHYGVLAPILATLFVAALAIDDSSRRARALWALAALYAVSANAFDFLRAWSATPLNILQSALFAAGLATFWLLREGSGGRRLGAFTQKS